MTPEATLEVPVRFDRAALEEAGYIGWRTWQQLRDSGLAEVPRASGCYVVQRQRAEPPAFVAVSPVGHFKGKDPTVPLERLESEWVVGASTVYIGKANELRTRLKAYALFGAGEPVAHWGGRLIWQLEDAAELLVAWRALTSPGPARDLERRLLARFAELNHGRRPLANLTG